MIGFGQEQGSFITRMVKSKWIGTPLFLAERMTGHTFRLGFGYHRRKDKAVLKLLSAKRFPRVLAKVDLD
jgi:hypothetical protein